MPQEDEKEQKLPTECFELKTPCKPQSSQTYDGFPGVIPRLDRGIHLTIFYEYPINATRRRKGTKTAS